MASLKVNGMACELSNARLTVKFAEDGKATSVVFDGRELMGNLSGHPNDPDREHCFYCDYHVNGKTRNLEPTSFEVIADTPELVHVAYVDEQNDLQLAYHLVMVADEPCVYGYVVAWCDADDVVVNELRTVYRFDAKLFITGYTAARQGLQPTAEHMYGDGEWLQDETYRLDDGCRYSNSDVYSKYDYAGTFAENRVWGQYSGGRTDDEWGAWFIPMDKSCCPTGPLKQELLVHYCSIILNYMTGAHFGTGDFDVPRGWKKLYGPWFMYFNHGADVVADAEARAVSEVAALPVSWVSEPSELYTGEYASACGSLELACPMEHPRGMTVVASDAPGDYFMQKAGRIYYDMACEGDRFAFERMQPGHYWLRARLNATSDACEYDLGEFDVAAGESVDLGALHVENTVRPVCWQLGYATGTTEPFCFSDQLRNYIWMSRTPKRLTWRAGEDADSDWYYLQRGGSEWTISFARPGRAAERYLLTVALAGTTAGSMAGGTPTCSLAASLNGTELLDETFDTDRAAYRSSVTGGKPQVLTVEIPASMLADENELTFTVEGYIMYDMVKLETL